MELNVIILSGSDQKRECNESFLQFSDSFIIDNGLPAKREKVGRT